MDSPQSPVETWLDLERELVPLFSTKVKPSGTITLETLRACPVRSDGGLVICARPRPCPDHDPIPVAR